MNRICTFWFAAIAIVALISSCMDPVSQDVSISNIRHGKKFTTSLSVASMEYDVQTKSQYSGAEDLVQNWNLFIYDAENDTRVGAYYRAADGQGTLSPLEFDVKLDHAYRYYAVANVGNVTSSAPAKDFVGGVSQMEGFLLTNLGGASDWNGVGIPSAWSGSQTFSSSAYRTNPASCVLNVQLTRLASRYSFRISHAQLSNWTLNITDFKVYGTTSAKPFASAGYTEMSTSQLPTTDYLLGVEKTFFNNSDNDNAYTAAQAINKDFVFSSLNTGRPVCLYALENLCGTGSNTGGGADGWGKVPGNKPSSTNPSYVEVTGTATLNDNSGASKSVTFRFYLGENEKNDYNVYRNKLYCITFTPTDESIQNGHDGNWKIEPGPFMETRSLAFEHENVRFRAGTSVIEGINKNPAALKYRVNIPAALSANGNLVVKNGTTAISSGSVIDAASLSLEAKDGIDATGQLEIRTIDGLLYDYLNIEIYNAFIQALPNDPITWDWNEHTQKDITLTSTVPWTVTVPSGWTLTYASGAGISGEQPAGDNIALKILPPSADYTDTSADASVTLSFAATGTDGDAVTLIRRYKPQVTSGGNTSASMEWEWNESTPSGAKVLTISSNEDWVIVWPDGDHSHWTVTPTSGAKTVTSISVYPVGNNDSTDPISGTFYVVPVRGGSNVDAGKLTVSLNHKANLPYINVSGSDLDEGALKWLWYQNGSKSFSVTSNIGWTATLDDDAAASFNISSNAGTVTVTPKNFNYAASGATGNVILRGTGDNSSVVQSVPVSQSRYPSITVDPSGANWLATAYDARPFGVTITAAAGETYQWVGSVANNPANTVNFSMSPATGNNGTSFTAGPASANGSSTQSNSATVTITLSGDYGSATKPTCNVSLAQASAAPFISISPNVSSLDWHWYEGTSSARKQIEVTTNVADWEIALEGTDASKFYCDYNSSNPNIIDIYPVNINDGAAISGVTLVIRSTDPGQSSLTKNVSLSQTKAPTISANPAQLDWPWDTPGTQPSAVTIDADESYTWSAALTDGSSYFSLSNATGSSGSSFSVTRSENNNDTEYDLTGTVRVSLVGEMGGQTRYVDVPLRQVKKTAFTLSVAPSYLTFAASANGEGSKQMITVTSNTSWSVTCPSGYSASTSGGSGDGSFYVWPTSTSSTYTQEAYISNGYVQVSGTGVSTQQVQMRRTSVSPFSHYRFDVEGGGTMGDYSYGSEDFYPVIYAVYEDNHEEYEDYGVNMGNINTSQTDVSGYGSWSNGSYKMTLNSSMPSSYDDLDGSITMTYTGYNYGLNGASATAYFTILGRPYIYVTDPSEWSWNQSGWSAEKEFGITTNRSSVSSTCTSGSGLFYVYASAYTHYARPYDPNYDSSPKTAKYNIYLTYFTDISDELTLTQGGKPDDPYLDHYRYYDLDVSIWSDGYNFPASGGSAQLSARATWMKQGVDQYGNDYGSATQEVDEDFSHFTIEETGSAPFTRSGRNVTIPENTSTSERSKYYTASYSIGGESDDDTIELNQAGKEASHTYTAAYVVVSLGSSSINVGSTTQASATLYVGTYTGSATSAPTDKSSYSWSSSSTSSTYSSSNSGIASVSGSTVTGQSAGTTYINSTKSLTGYSYLFDNEPAEITVPEYTYSAAYVVVSLGSSSINVGQSTTAYATLYEGTCTTTATSAPTSKSAYSWTSSSTSSSFNRSNTHVSISGSTITGVSEGTTVISSTKSLSGYSYLFDNEPAEIEVIQPVYTYTAAYIDVYPSSFTIEVGQTRDVAAHLYVGTYTGPATSAPTNILEYDWSYSGTISSGFVSLNTSVATVSGSTVTGAAVGTTKIRSTASVSGIYDYIFENADADVTVEPSSVVTLDYIAFDNSHYVVNYVDNYEVVTQREFHVIAYYSDGSDADVTNQCSYTYSSTYLHVTTSAGYGRLEPAYSPTTSNQTIRADFEDKYCTATYDAREIAYASDFDFESAPDHLNGDTYNYNYYYVNIVINSIYGTISDMISLTTHDINIISSSPGCSVYSGLYTVDGREIIIAFNGHQTGDTMTLGYTYTSPAGDTTKCYFYGTFTWVKTGTTTGYWIFN